MIFCRSVGITKEVRLRKNQANRTDTHKQNSCRIPIIRDLYHYVMVLDITNVNDNAPILKVSPSFPRITTNYPKGSLVSHVNVQDLDSVSQTFAFSINSGDPKKLFTIDNQGNVYTTQCLGTDSVGLYRLGIRVYDGVFMNLQHECFVSCKDTIVD